VSGFNTEYGSGIFSLIFIAEYGAVLFMAYLFSLIFLGGLSMLSLIVGFILSFIVL